MGNKIKFRGGEALKAIIVGEFIATGDTQIDSKWPADR